MVTKKLITAMIVLFILLVITAPNNGLATSEYLRSYIFTSMSGPWMVVAIIDGNIQICARNASQAKQKARSAAK